ncbi:3-keto-5-aminohexanoate cleavage protein [Streptomyces sp. NBC_01498]|uniref:3-keto-5-aminohexanoate cleavage protein n=1 Tax=Streptomyces sp. NBC_01498 TaxID=2975870 RepID=UPI002E7B5A7F|nr:3-keto-5-aminohexanoate cleavage protein [Streptomyces sp. NBC_01498]WTL25512.1 3-keto-5-aminohexanoate cleavage protein [Streptomyces sp. NBC_01498]
MSSRPVVQVCPNGARSRAEHPRLPVSPAELAVAARESVAAGAEDVHLHPKDRDGADALVAPYVAAVLSAVRAAVPGIPVGVTTGAWTEPDPERRAATVRGWTVLPDHASVNWHEDGADLVADALLERGVGVEAGLFSGTDAVRRFLAWPSAHRVLRVLAEVTDTDPDTAPAAAAALLAGLRGMDRSVPILLHGEDGSAWPVLRLAVAEGLSVRVGLEDVLHLPDGTRAPGNAELVREARDFVARSG